MTLKVGQAVLFLRPLGVVQTMVSQGQNDLDTTVITETEIIQYCTD